MNEQAWRTAIALAILLALTWGALTAARIDLRRELVFSVLRTLAQLLVVALVIAWIFSHPQWAVAYLVIMVLAAAFTANRRIGGDLRDGGAVLLAIAVGASATVAVVGSVGAIDLSAQEMLPFAAQMI